MSLQRCCGSCCVACLACIKQVVALEMCNHSSQPAFQSQLAALFGCACNASSCAVRGSGRSCVKYHE
jgi:hypothetical protein